MLQASGLMGLITTPETSTVIGCAMRVHTALGSGLLESAYQDCLAWEFSKARLQFARHVVLPLQYGDVYVERAYIADFIVEGSLLLELKCVDRILTVHQSQLVTYLRLAKVQKGLIINFRVQRLKDGLKSVILPQ